MDEDVIHERIERLVAREQSLREAAPDQGGSEERTAELRDIEVQLDRCWDLLRQRRARADAGQDPDGAHARPADEVEGYRQ